MIDEAMLCACGLLMEPVRVGSEFKRCDNCDVAARKIPNARDQAFQKVWASRVIKFYPKPGTAAA